MADKANSRGKRFVDSLSSGQGVLWIICAAMAYFAAFRIGLLFPNAGKVFAAVWPAGGIGLAVLLLSPRRLWPAMLTVFFVTGNAANLLAGIPIFNSIGFMTANILEPTACAWLIIRWCGEDVGFTRVQEFLALIFAATIMNACTSLIGAGTAALFNIAQFWEFYQTWWVADGLGILIVAPLIITWINFQVSLSRVRWSLVLEWGFFFLVWAATAFLTFHPDSNLNIKPYVIVAMLSWAALRLGPRAVTLALVVLTSIAVTSKMVTAGPMIWGSDSPADRLLMVQMYIGCTAVSGFLLVASYTESKSAERLAREDQARLRALGDNIPNGMIYQLMRDNHGNKRFVYVSEGVKQLNGVSAEDVLNDPLTIYRLVVEEDRPKIDAAEEASARDIRQFSTEVRIRRPDGQLRWMQISSSPHRLMDDSIVWDGIQMDITERKQSELEKAELKTQNLQLQKAESLGRMAGAIAHHFNNQLYAVMGNLEMAMDDLPRGADISETLAEAQKAARKAADVSRLMLTYLGQTPGKQEPIDLSQTCRTTLALLQTAVPKGMLLKADFPSCGPIIHADAGQIHQILTNLVTNAWESASDNRGAIGLTTKTISHMNIPTSNRFPIDWQPQKIAYACLEVSDTGCGISDRDIERLFDPFFTTKSTGRGLGLPIVIGIVKSHGGGITVESEPGRGSVFRVFLPVSNEGFLIQHDLPAMPEAQQTVAAEKLSKIEGGGKLLLIEDEEPVRNMAKKMLTRLGYPILEAKDGVEAVEVFKQHQDEILCVLSDLTMPRMNGWETLAALRNLSPDTPVILSSGYDEAKVMAEEHTEIPNAFLGKPYQLKGLRDTINRVLTNNIAEG